MAAARTKVMTADPDHGRPPRAHRRKRARPYDGHGRHRLGSLLGRRSAGVPDPDDVLPAVATTGTASTCCPGRRHVALVAEQPEKRRSGTRGGQPMSATLKLTHKAIGAEVRRGTYDVVVDGEWVGSVEMNHTIEIPVEPGRHTLQIRNGRNSSSTQTFDAADEEIVAFRCTGKRVRLF
jgi:hypothetical protein